LFDGFEDMDKDMDINSWMTCIAWTSVLS